MNHRKLGEAISKAEVGDFIWAVHKGSYGYIFILNAKCHRFQMSAICNTSSWDSSGPYLPPVVLRNNYFIFSFFNERV